MSSTPKPSTLRRWIGHPWVVLAAVVIAFGIGLWSGGGTTPSHEPADQASGGSTLAQAPTFYTCSMHPSVRLQGPDAKCPICFMDLIPVVEGAAGGSATTLVLDAETIARAGVETSRGRRFFPEARVRLFGKLAEDQTRVERLTAYFPGRIDELFLNYVGVRVERGEHVAELYSPELLTAFVELREAARSAASASSMSAILRESSSDVLEATRQKLRLLGIDAKAIAAAERGDEVGDRYTITAPMGGVVTELMVREGDYVDTGQALATVADLSHLWLDLEAYESQLSRLRWGQSVSFTVESVPGRVFEGRIAFIEPVVDARTRTVGVRVAVDNPEGRLKPGMFATATARMRVDAAGAVVSDELAGRWVSPMHPTVVKDGPGSCDVCGMDLVPAESLGIVGDPSAAQAPLVIPRTAVMYTGERSIVYVRLPSTEIPTFEAREVRIGPRAGDFVTVVDGLDEGEEVVTRGAFRIDSDMQIAAKPSMMMRGSAITAAASADVPSSFVAGLAPVYSAYLLLQEALADDDFDTAQQAAAAVDEAVAEVTTDVLVGPALSDWRRLRARLAVDVEAPTIEVLRTSFEALSAAVLALEARFGHDLDRALVRAYCPMAFDDTGAEWMQVGSTIDNPYFGSRMLRCGEVREALSPADGHEGHDHE